MPSRCPFRSERVLILEFGIVYIAWVPCCITDPSAMISSGW